MAKRRSAKKSSKKAAAGKAASKKPTKKRAKKASSKSSKSGGLTEHPLFDDEDGGENSNVTGVPLRLAAQSLSLIHI